MLRYDRELLIVVDIVTVAAVTTFTAVVVSPDNSRASSCCDHHSNFEVQLFSRELVKSRECSYAHDLFALRFHNV